MKNIVNNEKSQEFLKKIGKTLYEQRTVITKKSTKDFAVLLSQFSGLKYSPELIERMENGDPDISIINWVQIWQYYQNIDKIISAYDAKEMMYLAQQEFMPEIEREMIAHHRKED